LQATITLGDILTMIALLSALLVFVAKIAKTFAKIDSLEGAIKADVRNIVRQEMEPFTQELSEIKEKVNAHETLLCANDKLEHFIFENFDLTPKKKII